mmetsp:Transcript_21751/g.20872  ORF Transcript_21751/g.20872 Transcript_21751/m.20872 type:complete len:101 (+) Transcript_21751:571-873(+)
MRCLMVSFFFFILRGLYLWIMLHLFLVDNKLSLVILLKARSQPKLFLKFFLLLILRGSWSLRLLLFIHNFLFFFLLPENFKPLFPGSTFYLRFLSLGIAP